MKLQRLAFLLTTINLVLLTVAMTQARTFATGPDTGKVLIKP